MSPDSEPSTLPETPGHASPGATAPSATGSQVSHAPPGGSPPEVPTAPAASAPAKSRTRKKTSPASLVFLGILGLVVVGMYLGWFRGILSLDWLPGAEWQALTPEFVVLLFALMVPFVSLREKDRRAIRQFTLVGFAGAWFMAFASLQNWHYPIDFELMGQQIEFSFDWRYMGEDLFGVYAFSHLSQLLKVLFLSVGFLAVLGMGRVLKGKAEEDFAEFSSLILFAVLGMMVVASSREIITLILGIEMASLASYLLVGMRRDAVGAEASLKYFTLGAIASGLMLFGASLVYGMAGSTSLDAMREALTTRGLFDLGVTVPIVFLLAGFAFKISSIPFHAWAPDAYSGAPAPVAGMLAAASKAMGFIGLALVFVVGLGGVKANWELLLALVAVASMFYGNLVALQQTNIRRMLAYSSIAQAGYLLIAVVVAGSAQDGGVYAMGGGILHLIVNAAMKLGAFLLVGALLLAGIPDHLDQWKGLARRAPLLALAMVVFLLSMAGLPPLGGFQSKFILFGGAVDAGATQGLGWLTLLAVVAVVNSAVSLFYYLRVMRVMYVEEGSDGRIDVPASVTVAVSLCAILVLVIGLWPEPFVDTSMQAARDLLSLAGS